MKDDLLPISRIIPSLITMLALCAGLTAIKMAFFHRFHKAIIMILIAVFLDFIDGRVARALHSDSDFGAELDSLCDLVNFGIAPGLMMYFWRLHGIYFFGWGAVLFGAVCMATRLARFNVMLNDDKYDKKLFKGFFLGVPAPMGGILTLMPLMIHLEFGKTAFDNELAILVYYFIIGYLVASRIPTLSGKDIKINRRNVAFFIVTCSIIVIMMTQEPLRTIIGLAVTYLCFLPIGITKYHLIKKQSTIKLLA